MGRLIRIGESIRFKRGTTWNHEFVVDRVEDGKIYVIQATLRGVTDTATLDEIAPGGKFLTMPPPQGVSRDDLLHFCRSQVGIRYGFGTILSIAIDILTWNWFPSFRGSRKPSWICSALVNEGLRYAGFLHQWPNIYTVTPAEGYDALTN